MESFGAEEMFVLRADGTVDAATPEGAGDPPPVWIEDVQRAIEGRERCSLALDEQGLTLEAVRLVSFDARGANSKILVLVRERPPWMQSCSLTTRQREVGDYAAGGATVNEIARHLDISLHTVRSHLKAVYKQLGVCNRVELARALSLMPA